MRHPTTMRLARSSTDLFTPGRQPVILGLCAFTHDSAAALIHDGRLVGMVEEERLCGVKHTRAYPKLSIEWLLRETNLCSNDIDAVIYNFAGHRYLQAVPTSFPLLMRASSRSHALSRARGFTAVYRNYVQRMGLLRGRFPRASVRSVAHHRAHGRYAFASSGYERSAVLIIDSLGEIQSTTIADARFDGTSTNYQTRQVIRDPASLGYVYGAVTQHLGWRRGDEEGTVMALAALGDPARFRAVFHEAVRLTSDAFRIDPSWFPIRTLLPAWPRVTERFIGATFPPREPNSEILQIHADLAAALQERTENVVLHLAHRARDLTGAPHLSLGGGVAMNCVSVGKIIDAGLFSNVHVPSAPGDSGTAIGAAIDAHEMITGRSAIDVRGRCYLGPRYTVDQVRSAIARGVIVQDPATFLAERLAVGQIIGLFQSALEAGPRALGNRSILASPLEADVVARLNTTVKYREPFRPFAPVVLAGRASDYFQLKQPSPFMSIAVGVTDRAREQIPSVVHTNGTARVQTVTAQDNPFLAAVLTAFEALTGVPVLINTSLNIKGKPIAGTPQMALDCLNESGLDAIMFADGLWVSA